MVVAVLARIQASDADRSLGMSCFSVRQFRCSHSGSLSPAIAPALSAPATPRELRLTEAERTSAAAVRELHWNFFEQFVTATTQWLAPDNFQEDPEPVVAMRTSPTNIGLQLLASCQRVRPRLHHARGMIDDWSTSSGRSSGCAAIAATSTTGTTSHDLRVLEPAYISTVDSGNLAGHLIALKQACLEMTKERRLHAGARSKRLQAIAERARRVRAGDGFRFLFDDERKLFSIGYQHRRNTLDNSYYDLLASESRLAASSRSRRTTCRSITGSVSAAR